MKKNITVIIPAFNCEKTIIRCIDSILEQLSNEDDLIVVDDASSDDTLKLIKEKYNKQKIIILENKKNNGVSYTRNKGLSYTKTELVTFVDGDDFISPGYIDFIKKNFLEKTQLLLTGINYINNEDNIKMSLVPKKENDRLNKKILALDSYGLMSSCCNKVFLMDIIKKEKISFNENAKIMEDYEFNLKYCNNIHDISVSESSYYNYVYNNISASSCYKENLYDRYKQIKKIRNDFYKESSIILDNLNFNFLLLCINNLYKKNNNMNIKQRRFELKNIISSNDFKDWKQRGNKKNIVNKIIYISTLTNKVFVIDIILLMLHYIKNKISFINKLFRVINRRKQ